ncbi:MAG TPA: hypothetical protein PLY42_16730, partial [Nitrospira sp.]|nr:hypothetical protein [Nitrospira sp.]
METGDEERHSFSSLLGWGVCLRTRVKERVVLLRGAVEAGSPVTLVCRFSIGDNCATGRGGCGSIRG